MIKLLVRTLGKPSFVVELSKFRTAIGRSVRNDICLEDLFASRMHAEIRCEGDTCRVMDLGSANGTFVNGVRISGSTPIAPGDKLQIGESQIEVHALSGMPLATSRTVVGKSLSVEEVTANPETTRTHSGDTEATDKLLSVIKTVQQATGVRELPAGMERSKELLAIISQVGIALLSQLSLDEVLDQIVGLIFEAIPVDRAFLFLRELGEGDLVCKVASYRRNEPDKVERTFKISHAITEEVIGKGQSVLTFDALRDERFRQQESIIQSGTRSIMAVPLSVNKQVIGMIYVDSPLSINCLTRDDLQLLTAIASVAAIKIENALLLEQHIENERIRQQLNSARDIQCRLLPVTSPVIANYDITGISFPCFEVGGDYFDFINLKNGNYGIALGDVSGKGIDAAMLMSSLHASVRAQAPTRTSIGEMMGAVNRYIFENTLPNRFVTLFYGELNPRTHELKYTNAGHNPPILVRANGTIQSLDAGNIPVGIMGDRTYEERQVQFEPNDVLIIYSDGISESTNEKGEEFGVARLLEVAQKNRQLNVAQLRDRIDEAINQFVGKAPPADDMTLVLIKRVSSGTLNAER